METSNGNDSQKEEGELSDDEIEPERAPDNVPSAPRKDINELQNVNRNFDSRHNRLNTVWQDLPAPSMARSYPMGLPSSWDYNHGMGTLRYDRIRPMATPPPPPPQKWDPRENRPRLPNYRPLLPSPSPRMRNHHYSPSEYRNQPLRHVQQNTKQSYERYPQYSDHDVPKEPPLVSSKGDGAENYEQLLQMYQTIKEKLAEIQSQEKAEEEPISEVSEKPESQKPAPAKTQPSNKFTPRKPEKKVVVDITGEVAKEKNKTEPLLTVKQEPKDEEGNQAKSQESKDSTNEGGVNEGVVKDESEDIWEEATGIKTEPQDEEVVVLSDDESGKENELEASKGEEEEEDEEEEDMDLLQLRLIALASAVKKEESAERQENASSNEGKSDKKATAKKAPRSSDRNIKRTGGGTRTKQGRETGRQNQNTRSTGNRSLRSASSGRSPAARKQPAGSNVRRQNSRRNEDRRRESNAEKRRQEERKESLAEKRRLENKRRAEEEKRREIQRILTIDDPKEQVNRFLRMMDDKRYSEYNKVASLDVKKKPTVGKQTTQEKAPPLKDNYEEVEMDLDSDTESAAISMEQTTGFEDMMDKDYRQGYPYTVPLMSLETSAASLPIPHWNDPFFPGYSDIMSEDAPKNQNTWNQEPVYKQSYNDPTYSGTLKPWTDTTDPLKLPPPPPPPPLPPDEPLPPPPPEAPSPPPLPTDPPPDDESTQNSRQKEDPAGPRDIYDALRASPDLSEDLDKEEALLRSQLLKSLAARKMKEKLAKLKEESTSAGSSPTRSQSPFGTTSNQRPKPVKSKQPMTQLVIPIHEPVVINLNDDTSDEEEDPTPTVTSTQETNNIAERVSKSLSSRPSNSSLLSGLDSFLKEARLSSGNQEKKQKEDMERKKKLQAMEEDLKNQRIGVEKGRQLFRSLLICCSKNKKEWKDAQNQVEDLKRQLEEAERLAVQKKEQFDKSRKQARSLRDKVNHKVSEIERQEVKVQEEGVQVYGENYSLPSSTREVTMAGKRQGKNLAVTVINEHAVKKVPPGKENIQQTKKKSATEIIEEKERLQNLEKEYARRIQHLKMANAKRKIQARKARISDERKSSEIPRLEKIEIDLTEGSSEVEDSRPAKRRRSLLELNPSTKPNIEKQPDDKSIPVKTFVSAKDNPKKSSEFNVPNSQQLKKLKQLLDGNISTYLSKQEVLPLTCSYCQDIFTHETQEIPAIAEHRKVQRRKEDASSKIVSYSYVSPLRSFKSYRFSPYFRTKNKLSLSSVTFSNKLNVNRVLCKYDLQGTCNDEECGGQHQKDYQLSEQEILQDIVAYNLSLCGVASNTSPSYCSRLIDTYVKNLTKQHSGRLTSDQLRIFLVSQVLEKSKHKKPYSMFVESRKWRVQQTDKKKKSDKSIKELSNDRIEWEEAGADLDNVIGDTDVRYFMLDSSNIQDMESAVLENPEDTAMWVKLAHRKLADTQSHTPAECLDHALNVLSRGLEKNKNSAELWENYLTLFASHPDKQELGEMCQTALQLAPSYAIWWKYLSTIKSLHKKVDVCDSILNFLKSQDAVDPDLRSFRCLEIMLYKMSLYCWSGRNKTAASSLQSLLAAESPNKYEWLKSALSVEDRCVLWVTFLHIMGYKSVPPQLYNPTNQSSGRIVCKEKLTLNWELTPDLLLPVEHFKEMMWKACDFLRSLEGEEISQGSLLFTNLFHLLKVSTIYEEAANLGRQLLMKNPSLVSVWLCVADLYSHCGEPQATRQVFADSLDANPFSAHLYFYAANFELKQGETDKAIETLEKSVLAFYVVDVKSELADPNLLFCSLLNEDLPVKYTPPNFKETVGPELIQEENLYLWLNYSLLLELQGDTVTAIEAYETMLGSMVTTSDLTEVWCRYLAFCQRLLLAKENITMGTKTYISLFNRALSSIPTVCDIPHSPGSTWLNYQHVNRVIDLYIASVPKDDRLSEYQLILEKMPLNVELLLRVCQEAIQRENFYQAKSLCTTAVIEKLANPALWKMAISLSLKLETVAEARRLYHKAVQFHPYHVTFWKDFLLFEITHGSCAMVPRIQKRCQELGVDTEEFSQYLTNYAKASS
ncbi:zinc finger C3H1 domain-containing protein-like isoform X2 [Crassostrea virginica]